jgi:hypothetical protein
VKNRAWNPGVGVADALGVPDGVSVADGVLVGVTVGVAVLLGVLDGVGVLVRVPLEDCVGVLEGLAPTLMDAVPVGVKERVDDGLRVGVRVDDGVRVAVMLPLCATGRGGGTLGAGACGASTAATGLTSTDNNAREVGASSPRVQRKDHRWTVLR